MSNLKNVLKAGFLLSASLLATGCETDNPGTPITTPTNNKPLTLALDMGGVMRGLSSGAAIVERDKSVTITKDYDVLANVKVAGSTSVSTLTKDSVVDLTGITSDATFLLKSTSEIGALFLEGQLDPNKRVVAHANVSGALKINAFAVRNAVVNGATTTADSINSQYAYVGIDAGLGYESARAQDVPLDIHAQGSLLSAGVAKASKSTKVTKISNPITTMAKSKVATPPAAHTNKLTLNISKAEGDFAGKLNAAGLTVHADQGGLDIGGRVANVVAANAVITSISDQLPELVLPASATTTTVDKAKGTKLALSAGAATAKAKKAVSPAQAAAKSNASANKNAISQSLVKSGNAHNFLYEIKQGGYSAEIGSLSVGANTDIQAIAHHALVVHDLNLQADLGVRLYVEGHTWDKLDAGTPWATIAGYTGDVAGGQAMMKMLAANDHSVHESDIVEESKATIQYQHFDSNTPFAMYVTNSVTSGKPASTGPGTHNLVLSAIDLASDHGMTAGVYAMPLVKDFTGTLPNLKEGAAEITLADASGKNSTALKVSNWKIQSNGYHDLVLFANVENVATSKLGLGSGAVTGLLMGSKAQAGRSMLTATVDGVVERLNPTNLVAASFANLSTSRINQAAQFASLARGVDGTTTSKLGAVEQYAVSFNHNGTQVGFTYNLDGGNAFAGAKGSTSFGANVASDVLGLKAIVSVDASADAGKNAYATVSNASYNASLTFAKAYSLGGLSVVPMTGFGVASNALNGYSAVVPMAAGSLGLHMNDVAFSAATYHAGVNVALDEFVAASAGVNASLAFGVAGYLAATADAKLSTSEGKSADLQLGGSSVTPYAQFNVGFASGEKVNALISSSAAAVSFGIDR